MNAETPAGGTSPTHLMELFNERASAGDLDGLLELYEPDAVFRPKYGVTLKGIDEIRTELSEFLALKPRLTATSEPDVLAAGDIALVTNFWTTEGTAPDGATVRDAGTSADVARRQADGSWLLLMDQPRGRPSPE